MKEEWYQPTWEEIIDESIKQPLKFTKPLRLIELFAGIGSQHEAFKRLQEKGILKVPFESYRVIEFDKYAIASYNAIHNTNFSTQDITKISAEDLGIVDTDKYQYLMFYSFPCQDISVAGKSNGFEKGTGTRSGLLWEVERLLNECKELPQILVMENVDAILNSRNIENFKLWLDYLDSKGYTSKYQVLNATDYGIPQHRKRCFCVSWLSGGGNEYYYNFPTPKPLNWCLQDFLEKEPVDEKYYLPEEDIKEFIKNENIDIRNT